ncbi:MAG: GGDEF domain-containing protein [Deltaproteobacteria bacterium]|nr:GGDEF domain-containing protein [Deltaproteobacteria bacterium]
MHATDGRYRQGSGGEDRVGPVPARNRPATDTGGPTTGTEDRAQPAVPDRPSRAARETRPALEVENRPRPCLPSITAEYQIVCPGVRPAEPEERHPALLFLTGSRVGAVVVLEGRPLVVGRDPACDIVVPEETISRRQARLLPAEPGGVVLEDLGSRNGTVVNGERITRRTLADGDRIMLGRTVLKFALQSQLEEECQQRLYELSTRDGLTNLFNRRYFDERLQAELAFARRHGSLLGLLLLDLDHFKRLNDIHGHVAGDRALMEVARAIGLQVRGEDMVARYGGEEIVVLVRDIPRAGVAVLAERLRAAVESLRIRHDGKELTLTASVGAVALRPVRTTTASDLIAGADRLLYEAKSQGRNRTCVAEGDLP